ncbi:hypothetical protein [Luteimonas sp. SDU101]|uniref:hypothetical protein n=1 Tax=unclassified Luteimonas TaxID=2629088 RepID=UPI003EBEC16F
MPKIEHMEENAPVEGEGRSRSWNEKSPHPAMRAFAFRAKAPEGYAWLQPAARARLFAALELRLRICALRKDCVAMARP